MGTPNSSVRAGTMMMPPPSPRIEPTIPAVMAKANISSVVMRMMAFSFAYAPRSGVT